MKKIILFYTLTTVLASLPGFAAEYHVSAAGSVDGGDGSREKPFGKISAAAQIAQPGDTITVHEGVYRERVDPPRGGNSDNNRIIYQAAQGEKVIIKGSEVVKGWERVRGDTWKVELPSDFFGEFNPYKERVYGDWFTPVGARYYHTGQVYLNGHWLKETDLLSRVLDASGKSQLWYTLDEKGKSAESDSTTIYAQFKGVDPNKECVEINVRQSVFYPTLSGRNYITVRGLTVEHAATNWAPPTAEQIGAIGTHWSKGWVIENNTVRYSSCVGITLGKHGDKYDNTSANSAEGYVKTIERALEQGWSRENIGGHVVRNNHISYCEQAGIVGSMGAVFSRLTGNTIHDINMRGIFSGAEMAGIKIHAPIDTLIAGNRIYRCSRGVWLDWMTQGARVTGNLLYDNGPKEDLFVEVNHGPFVVDGNLFLSKVSLLDASQGGAYAHNLFAGRVSFRAETRKTPYHPAHSVAIAGLHTIRGGSNRYYNNLFAGGTGLVSHNRSPLTTQAEGNIYIGSAEAYKGEVNGITEPEADPGIKVQEVEDSLFIEMTVPEIEPSGPRSLVVGELLGKAKIPDLPFKNYDGTPLRIEKDYFGEVLAADKIPAGPFSGIAPGKIRLKIWDARGRD